MGTTLEIKMTGTEELKPEYREHPNDSVGTPSILVYEKNGTTYILNIGIVALGNIARESVTRAWYIERINPEGRNQVVPTTRSGWKRKITDKTYDEVRREIKTKILEEQPTKNDEDAKSRLFL